MPPDRTTLTRMRMTTSITPTNTRMQTVTRILTNTRMQPDMITRIPTRMNMRIRILMIPKDAASRWKPTS